MLPASVRLMGLALSVSLAGCAPRPAVAPPVRPIAMVPASARSAAIAEAAVGRWIAVEVDGDTEASRDLDTGALEKVLVVNPGGHVILRGTDRGTTASFSGRLQGRVITFADLPGAALVSLNGTRLVLSDPSGRSTQFVRAAD